jgi:hypothetical protein
MCDATDRYELAKANLNELEDKLLNNDDIGKKWAFMHPNVIQKALDSQKIKVV